MTCKKCGGNNVKIDVIQTSSKSVAKTRRKSFIGWFLSRPFVFMKHVATMGITLLLPKKKHTTREKTKFTNKRIATCQDCGKTWTMWGTV